MTASSVAVRANPHREKAKARTPVVSAIRAGQLYPLLGALPTSSDEALLQTLDKEIRELEARIDADAKRPSAARGGLLVRRRLRTLLSQPRWRTAYDFRHGFVHAAERIAKAIAGEGLSVEELRCIWRRVNPDLAARAAELLKVPSSSCLLEAAPLDPFHPRIVALAPPGLDDDGADAKSQQGWESATTPVEVAWDGDGPARVVSSLVQARRGPSNDPKATTTTALREAVETKPDGIWADLAHFRMVEILQSLARADTVVEVQLCHEGALHGRLVLDDRLVVHAATPDAIAERALFALLDARSGELFVRCGASDPPTRNMELRLEAALVRYFEQTAANAALETDEELDDGELELLPDSEFALAEVASEDAERPPAEPSKETAVEVSRPDTTSASATQLPQKKSAPQRLRFSARRGVLRQLAPTKRSARRRGALALTLAFAAGALFMLLAALIGASLAYLVLRGAPPSEPAPTPGEPALYDGEAEPLSPPWRIRDALPPRRAAL